MKIHNSILATILLSSSSMMVDASIVVGTPTSANCNPFQCPTPGFGPERRYMQIYDSSFFDEALTISSIEFFKVSPDSNLMNFDYQITLSTTSSSSTSFSFDYDQNTGSNATLFAAGSFVAAEGESLAFFGNDFYYDPNDGNLLFDIVTSNFENADNSLPRSLQMTFDSGVIRIYDGRTGCSGPCGLVTGFNTVSEVPVPASAWLFGSSLISLLGFKRQRDKC